VAKIEDHELIATGLYKKIRHPGYLGQLIIIPGISACLSNWLSIMLTIVPVLFGYLRHMNNEKKFWAKQMGEKYRDYPKVTKKLIPMIY